jgi:hypothetical protein
MAGSNSFPQTAPTDDVQKSARSSFVVLSLTEDLKQQEGNDDGRNAPVGCRPKFLRCLCQRFGENDYQVSKSV